MAGIADTTRRRVCYALAWWNPRFWAEERVRWLRVQLSPWFAPHCRLLRRLLRLSATRDISGWIDLAAAVQVARFDVAMNYRANPSAVILQRPKAQKFCRFEDENGAITWYAGSREGEIYVRVYDYAAYHGVAGPLMRVEAEVHPSPQPQLGLLEASVGPDDPFRRGDDGACQADETLWGRLT